MDTSIFMDKSVIPTSNLLLEHLQTTYPFWMEIRDFVFEKYPKATEEWYHSGKKYGWTFRIKDKKRAIVYLLPRKGFFKTAFVYGQKATMQILESSISDSIKTELENARVYAEGRGIRIAITNNSLIKDIKKLVDIKLAN